MAKAPELMSEASIGSRKDRGWLKSGLDCFQFDGRLCDRSMIGGLSGLDRRMGRLQRLRICGISWKRVIDGVNELRKCIEP